MSSKIKYMAMPTAQRSQFVDTLGAMISQNATDRRYEQQSLKDDRRFQLQLARQNRQDALAFAKEQLATKRYNDSIAYRNQRDAKADADKANLLKATIAEASADPINVDYSTEKTGVFDVMGADGKPVMQDEYDQKKLDALVPANATLDQIKAIQARFEPQKVDEIPLNQVNDKNKWAAETIKRIDLDPRYATQEQRTKALKEAMVKAGYSGLVDGEDSGFDKMSKSIKGSIAETKNDMIEGLYDIADWLPGKKMDRAGLNQSKLDDEMDYKVIDPAQTIRDMAKKYEGTLVKNKNIKTFNERLKQSEKDRIAKLYEDLKTGNKVKKTKVDTRRIERTRKEIVADIRAKAAKEMKKIDAKKNLSLTEKAGYARGILKARNEALSKYAKTKQDAQDFKQWNVKESIKSGNKMRENLQSELSKYQSRKKLLQLKLSKIGQLSAKDKKELEWLDERIAASKQERYND